MIEPNIFKLYAKFCGLHDMPCICRPQLLLTFIYFCGKLIFALCLVLFLFSDGRVQHCNFTPVDTCLLSESTFEALPTFACFLLDSLLVFCF